VSATVAVYLIILLAVVAVLPAMAAGHHLHAPRRWRP